MTKGTTGASDFVPVPPCRIMDTRNPAGSLGGPLLARSQKRTVPVLASACGLSAGAAAYSLNFTVVPRGPLGFLTVWPTGTNQPFVSTLNALTGAITANNAVIPAGANGAIDVFATDDTDLVIDVNGYFATNSGTSGLSLFVVNPCRAADTRLPAGPLGGPQLTGGQKRDFNLTTSACGIPSSAQALSLNATLESASGALGLSYAVAGGRHAAIRFHT